MSIKKAKLSAIVIDEDTTKLEVLAALLARVGIEARTYAGVEAALAALKRSTMSLRFFAIDVPGMIDA